MSNPFHPASDLDPVDSQLAEYSKNHKQKQTDTSTTGAPVPYQDAPQTVGPKGPILLQDQVLVEQLAHLSRERIPERVVHAKGAGAFGYFEVTHDITQYTSAKIFSHIGKKTSMAVRFSLEIAGKDYADTVTCIRGFALKFYTEDGNWDLAGLGFPVFPIRDTMLFPGFVHAIKKNPVTNITDYNMYWDFCTLRQETVHANLMIFSDRGIPKTYRHMHGFGVNTFALVNKDKNLCYCKFHYLTNQGIETMDNKEAAKQASDDPDYHVRDLYNNIAQKNFPSWTFYIQVMTPDQAKSSPFDPFDVTKVWPHKDYPLIQVGKFTLNRNPQNFFAEVEQIAFNPAHLVPGIQPTQDRILQGRLFSYGDAQMYRLGVNHNQLPVNSPFKQANYIRDGYMAYDNQGGGPNYYPNSFGGPEPEQSAQAAKNLQPSYEFCGFVNRYDIGDDDNFTQAKKFYHDVLSVDQRKILVGNIVDTLKKTVDFVQKRTVKMFSNVDEEFAKHIQEGLDANKKTTAML